MDIIFLIFIFIFGIFIGSFLGVVIDRLPRGESIIKGRSHCDSCKKSLGAIDLIPILSFLFLQGKCRHCKARLSWFYPTVEIITGVLFVLTALQSGIIYNLSSITYEIEFIYYLFIISTLVVIFFIDLKYGIIPFSLILPVTLITFLYLLFNTHYFPFSNLTAALGACAFFLLLFLVTRGRGMGFGDVVYAFFMGLLLGLPQIVAGLYLSFVSGAVVSLILIGLKKKKMKGGTVPFGPFLVFGTIVVLLWGEPLIHLVLSYLMS